MAAIVLVGCNKTHPQFLRLTSDVATAWAMVVDLFPNSVLLPQHLARLEHCRKIKLGLVEEDDDEEWFDVSKFDAKECRIERDIVIQNWEKIKPFIEDHCQMPNCAIRDFCTCSFRIHVSEFVSSTPPQQIYFEIRRLLADIDRRNF